MRGFFGAFLCIATTLSWVCQAAYHYQEGVNCEKTFKEMLDWVSDLNDLQLSKGADYKKYLVGIVDKDDVDGLVDVAFDVQQSITNISDLRKMLVKNVDAKAVTRGNLNKEVAANIVTFLGLLPCLYFKLENFQKNVKEWDHGFSPLWYNKYATKINDGLTSPWFTDNGFDVDNVNDVTTIVNVDEALDKLLPRGKPLHRVLSAATTYQLMKKPVNTAEKLSWLLLFASSSSDNEMKGNMKSHVAKAFYYKGTDFVDYLDQLASPNGALVRILEGDNLTALEAINKIYKKPGMFASPVVTKYWGTLTQVCKVLVDEVKGIKKKVLDFHNQEKLLKEATGKDGIEGWKLFFKELGFQCNDNVIVVNYYKDKVDELIGEESPMVNLCDLVKKYNEKTHFEVVEEKPAEVKPPKKPKSPTVNPPKKADSPAVHPPKKDESPAVNPPKEAKEVEEAEEAKEPENVGGEGELPKAVDEEPGNKPSGGNVVVKKVLSVLSSVAGCFSFGGRFPWIRGGNSSSSSFVSFNGFWVLVATLVMML